MASRWIKNSKLSNRQVGKLIDYFALEAPAKRAAKMGGINRHSADRVYQLIRVKLARESERESPLGGRLR